MTRRRFELTGDEWLVIEPFLPNKPRGVPRVDDRRVINGILWRFRTGSPWADIPERYGPNTTCYNRFVRWRKAHAQPLALRAAAMAAGHVRCVPRLVDEDQALGIKIELTIKPALALPQDIGPILLDSMASLFLRVMPRRAKKR